MLGERIDYRLLRLIAHDRNRATEAELDERARRSTFSIDDARRYLDRVQQVYFDGRLPVDPSLAYLDVGCGNGRLCIGLAAGGARDVTGIEIVPRHVVEAETIARGLPEASRPRFLNVDIHDWTPPRPYDVVFVLGAMEHIHDPRKFLEMLPKVMAPQGRAFVSHEPFEGPIGDHMTEFFRFQIPWRGLLFSEQAILRLRREYFRPTDPAQRYEEIAGGLNRMSLRTYQRWVREAGLEFETTFFNSQLKHHPRLKALFPISRALTALPRVQGFFTLSAFSILRRRA